VHYKTFKKCDGFFDEGKCGGEDTLKSESESQSSVDFSADGVKRYIAVIAVGTYKN
jgi:hypothetical protein